MTILKVNAIQNTSGTSYLPSTGTIIQSVQYEYRDAYESSSLSEFDLPSPLGDGSASITPLNSSSRILFSSVMHGGQEDTWRGNFFKCYYRIGNGSWTQFTAFAHYSWTQGSSGLMNSVGTEFLLSTLNTTSIVSFKVTQIGHPNGGNLHLNQNNFTSSTSNDNSTRCSSTITLREISA